MIDGKFVDFGRPDSPMFGTLLRKEILDHVLGLRFLLLSLIGTLIIWLSLFAGYTYHEQRLIDYRYAQEATQERIRQYRAADRVVVDPVHGWIELGTVQHMIHKPPTPMTIFVRGLDASLGRSVPIGNQ